MLSNHYSHKLQNHAGLPLSDTHKIPFFPVISLKQLLCFLCMKSMKIVFATLQRHILQVANETVAITLGTVQPNDLNSPLNCNPTFNVAC